MSKNSNYVKLTAYGPASLHDSEAVSKAPDSSRATCTVSWVFHFTTKGQAASALVAAQAKRTELRRTYQDVRFELSTWLPSLLRGVPCVGTPIAELGFGDDDEAAAEGLAS